MRLLFRISCFLLAGWLAFGVPGTASAQRITAVSDYWCPYACLPGNMSGYIVDILKQTFKGTQYNLSYEIISWQEALRYTTTGKYQALIGCTKGEAPNFIYPVEPIGFSTNAVYVRSDSTRTYNGIQSFSDATLGAAFGYDYGTDLNWYILQNPKKVALASTEKPTMENIYMLINNQVDYIVGDEQVIEWNVRLMGVQKEIKKIGTVGDPLPIYVGFAPTNTESPALAKALGTKLNALRESGELQKILDKYSVKDWK